MANKRLAEGWYRLSETLQGYSPIDKIAMGAGWHKRAIRDTTCDAIGYWNGASWLHVSRWGSKRRTAEPIWPRLIGYSTAATAASLLLHKLVG